MRLVINRGGISKKAGVLKNGFLPFSLANQHIVCVDHSLKVIITAMMVIYLKADITHTT